MKTSRDMFLERSSASKVFQTDGQLTAKLQSPKIMLGYWWETANIKGVQNF